MLRALFVMGVLLGGTAAAGSAQHVLVATAEVVESLEASPVELESGAGIRVKAAERAGTKVLESTVVTESAADDSGHGAGRAVAGRAVAGRAVTGRAVAGRAVTGRAVVVTRVVAANS